MLSLLKDLLNKNIEAFGEYPFLYYGDIMYTNVETREISDRLAAGFVKLGIQKDDRIIVCMPNCPEVLFAYQGITRSGAVIVPVMYLLHSHEIEYIIKNSGAKAVVASSETWPKIKEAVKGLEDAPFIISSDPVPDTSVIFMKEWTNQGGNERQFEQPAVLEKDPAVILYTSGTTGKPKGVILTHKNLYSNAESSASISREHRGTTIGVLPLAHVFGLTVSNICYLKGSSIIVFSKFHAEEIFQAIHTFKVRTFSVVPAMVHAMYHHPAADKYNLSSLEKVSSGSAPLPAALAKAFREKFQAEVVEGYGLSEAAPIVTASYDGRPHKPGSVGLPIPGVEIKIVDQEGKELNPNEVGELLVKGDNITPGYFENEEETKKVIHQSWLSTGDLAKRDEDGYLYIVDRKKDLIIRGGFNIYPRDIEELLAGHPDVLEAAVVGVPDERMGEEVIAFIVKKAEGNTSEKELILFCHSNIAKNKSPRRIIFIDTLPRNGVGKVLKTKLREIALKVDLFQT